MELMLLRVFQQQILLQCQYLLFAADDLVAAMPANGRADPDRAFFAIQNFLNAAANISKGFWGQAGSRAEERRELRESVGLADSSPLRNVTMRNHFEHFDERLETWWKTSRNHNIIDRNFANRSFVTGSEPVDWFRNFDPASGDLYFWSQDFNVNEIIREVQLLLPKLTLEASKPWLPPLRERRETATGNRPDEAKGE
jgi:hypothetical protein